MPPYLTVVQEHNFTWLLLMILIVKLWNLNKECQCLYYHLPDEEEEKIIHC